MGHSLSSGTQQKKQTSAAVRLFLLLPFILLASAQAQATYVASGKQNFAIAGSTACVPNGGGVTAGNREVIFVQANTSTSVTIASTRVVTWTLDQSIPNVGSTVLIYMWSGVPVSNGAETITVSFTSGTALIGSACGEYTSNTVDTGNSSLLATVAMTSTQAVEDIVAGGTSGVGGTTLSAPFTQRQVISYLGTDYVAFGDRTTSSTGTYTASFGGGGGHSSLIDGLYGGAGGGGFGATHRRRQVIKYTPRAARRKEPNA